MPANPKAFGQPGNLKTHYRTQWYVVLLPDGTLDESSNCFPLKTMPRKREERREKSNQTHTNKHIQIKGSHYERTVL